MFYPAGSSDIAVTGEPVHVGDELTASILVNNQGSNSGSVRLVLSDLTGSNLSVGEERKFEIIRLLTEQADWGEGQVTNLDGIRVDFANSWGLIRASNTTPVLVMRFEADSSEELNRVKTLFRERLQAVAPDLKPTF